MTWNTVAFGVLPMGRVCVTHTLRGILPNTDTFSDSFFSFAARQNSHAFASPDEEARQLIYNHQLVYTGQVSDSFVQCYFFD